MDSYKICRLKSEDNNKLSKIKKDKAKNSKKKEIKKLGDNMMNPIMVKKWTITCKIVFKVGLFTTTINKRVNFSMCYMFYNL